MSSKEEGVTVINGTDMGDGLIRSSGPNSRSSSPGGDKGPIVKKFQNGWSREQEKLMADWSDIASCYRWMHDQSEKVYSTKTLWINVPVIVLSTLGGTANFGIQSLFENDESAKKYASFGIGGISLLAGLLTTMGNYLRYAQLEESHRVASIAWGKFQRLIAVELALNPNDRMDSLDFLKICRAELDRLIEQSPPIPKSVIINFEARFGTIKDIKKPDICGSIEHTSVFQSSETRLKKLATEAALMLKRKKETLKELVTPEIEERIAKQVNERLEAAIEERKKRLEGELEERRKYESEEEMLKAKLMEERRVKLNKELEIEKQKLEEELRVERQKAKDQEEAMRALAEERRRKIEEEIELEKKKLTQSAPENLGEGAHAPHIEKFSGNAFENRLNMNRQQRGRSIRRKSLLGDHIYALETDAHSKKGLIMVSDGTPRVQADNEPKNQIIIISKD